MRNGRLGLATCLPSNASGGARSADDVTAQPMTTATKTAGDPGGATNGSARNASTDTTVAASTKRPMRPTTRPTRSAATPAASSAKTSWSAISIHAAAPLGGPACATSCRK